MGQLTKSEKGSCHSAAPRPFRRLASTGPLPWGSPPRVTLFRNIFERGQLVVEIIVAFGLASLLIPGLFSGFIAGRSGKVQETQRTEALTYLKEAEEAVRSVREAGWNSFAINGNFHPERQVNAWVFSNGSETINNFTRSVFIEDAFRNATGTLVEIGGTADPSTKKITLTVSWGALPTQVVSNSFYLTRFLGNSVWVNTTLADFDAGVKNSVQVTNTAGGEVTLANNNKAKWCSPALSPGTIDLPDGPPKAVAAFADPVSANVPNTVFTATAPEDSTQIKMAYLDITANTDEPAPTLKGKFTLDSSLYSSPSYFPSGIGLDNNFKTNDIKSYVSGSGKKYALIATDKPDHEVIVVQVNDGVSDSYQDPVNKIYKYWTYFNTKMYNTSFNGPTSNAAVAQNAGDNNGYGTNPANAYASDGSFAVDTNSGNGTGVDCAGTDKDKHRYYDFNFVIPSGATIDGIEMSLIAKADSTSGNPKICAQLSWDGGSTWTSTKSTANLTTSSATYSLGGSADTWGRPWSDSNFTNPNFRVRLINVASNTSRDFSLDYVGVKVYYNGIGTQPNDQAPFGYGGRSLAILGNRGYIASGGYLYTFDLSNIDSKSPTSSLDQIGCRIQLDGYDCSPGTGTDRKYSAGETGASWSDTTGPAHDDCSDGGNVELFATNHLSGVTTGGSDYIFAAVGAGTNPELDIVNVTNTPDSASNPTVGSASCGRISGGNSGWKMVGSLDFNSKSSTEEAANSVFAKSDGTRAYMSSNGGIDGNSDGAPDSHQFYVIDTATKTAPKFLSGVPGSPTYGPTSGYYDGDATNIQLFPRRSLTVLNGLRAIIVGQDGAPADQVEPKEYQVLNIEDETAPFYCGGINFAPGFNDLTSVSEADSDNFVYMVANTMEKQLKIIEGGPDDGIYVPSGVFESGIFTAPAPAAFNRFTATVNQPANTTVRMQVGVAVPSGGSCNGVSFNYVGPGGDPSAYFTAISNLISGTIPVGSYGSYQNPEACFKYKAYLDTTDFNQTPQLLDTTVNYSP